jgi:sporulation protein YlmC with PRC-barrel domain
MRAKLIGMTAFAALAVSGVAAQEVLKPSQTPEELRGSWVIGATVTSPDGESVGTINDILLNEEDGSVSAAILSVGGFLGLGSKQIAVEWSELQMNYDAREVRLAITRDEAEEASAFQFRDRESFPAPAAGPAGGSPGMGGPPAGGIGAGPPASPAPPAPQ